MLCNLPVFRRLPSEQPLRICFGASPEMRSPHPCGLGRGGSTETPASSWSRRRRLPAGWHRESKRPCS